MDTMRCVDQNVRFWEGDNLIPHSVNSDSVGLYSISTKNMEIPFVKINDSNIINKLDTCLIEASRCDYLQFPDSSGYFVELFVFEETDDSLKLGMSIKPISNYYMAEHLASWRNDIVYDWYGHNDKDVQGCFFMNDILCVVTSFGGMNYEKASCLFSDTDTKLRLVLLSPKIMKVTRGNQPEYSYYFNACDTINNQINKKIVD